MSVTYVGCDDGYAQIKMVYMTKGDGEPKSLSFPSRVTPGVAVSAMTGEDASNTYSTAGQKYQVGAPIDAIDTRFDGYPTSDANRVLVHHGLRLAGLWGKDVSLATGLPVGTYFSGAAAINDTLKRAKEASLRKPVRGVAPAEPPRLMKCITCPEAIAAIIDHQYDYEGNERVRGSGTWAVIDIGGRTTDIAVIEFDDAGEPQVNRSSTGTLQVGVMKVVDLVARRVSDDNDVPLDELGDISSVLRKGSVRLFGRDYDARLHLDAALNQVGGEIAAFVQRRLQSGARLEKLLLVGGGAEYFPVVRNYYKQAFIPDEPRFANARGMLKLAIIEGEGD